MAPKILALLVVCEVIFFQVVFADTSGRSIQLAEAPESTLQELYERREKLLEELRILEERISISEKQEQSQSPAIPKPSNKTTEVREVANEVTTKLEGIGALMRTTPSINSAVIFEIPPGSSLQAVSYEPPVWRVKYQGRYGYVHDHYISDGSTAEKFRETKKKKKKRWFFRKERPQASSPFTSPGCCRVCTKGKPCGNSCISRKKECHQPPGCAC